MATGVQVSAMTLALIRNAIGVAVLFSFFQRITRARISRRDFWPILALGVGQFAVLISLANLGMETVSAAAGGVIFATFPLVTILLATLTGCGVLTALHGIGSVLSVAGVAICLRWMRAAGAW